MTRGKGFGHHYNNDFFCTNKMKIEDQAQWRDKTKGLSTRNQKQCVSCQWMDEEAKEDRQH